MAQDKQLNDLLRWSITNSSTDTANPQPAQRRDPAELAALQKALFSGPSEAQLMVQEMAAVKSVEKALEDRVTAFDNFHMLLEGLDNANNLTPLKLWTPLLEELENEDEELRMIAAWCVSTAVQNNVKTQKEVRQF
jgi:hsp70-interacting protein